MSRHRRAPLAHPVVPSSQVIPFDWAEEEKQRKRRDHRREVERLKKRRRQQ